MSLAVDKVISNYRRTTLTTGKLILELAQALERLDDGQREHYRLLSKALLSCYVNDGQRAALIIGRDLRAIRCMFHQLSTLCKAKGKSSD